MSASDFFSYSAMTGILLGPYLIYEAKTRAIRGLGGLITLGSIFVLCHAAWGYFEAEAQQRPMPSLKLSVEQAKLLCVIALPLSILLGWGHQLLKEIAARRSVFALGAELEQFAQQCNKIVSMAHNNLKRREEDAQQMREYLDRYSSRIIYASNTLVSRGAVDPGLDKACLGSAAGSSLQTAELVAYAARTFTRLGHIGSSFISESWMVRWQVYPALKTSALYFLLAVATIAFFTFPTSH